MERQTSLVNYKYVIEKLNLPVSEPVKTWLGYLHAFERISRSLLWHRCSNSDGSHRSSSAFTMEPAEFYGIRHLYTFLNFFVAMICFYLLLKRTLQAPRNRTFRDGNADLDSPFFCRAFTTIKMYCSFLVVLAIISIYFIFRWFRKKTTGITIVAGILLAFTINTA